MVCYLAYGSEVLVFFFNEFVSLFLEGLEELDGIFEERSLIAC